MCSNAIICSKFTEAANQYGLDDYITLEINVYIYLIFPVKEIVVVGLINTAVGAFSFTLRTMHYVASAYKCAALLLLCRKMSMKN